MEQPNAKTCTRCEQLKSASEYSPDRRNKSGLQSACRPCANQPRTAEQKTDANWNRRVKYNGGSPPATRPQAWIDKKTGYMSTVVDGSRRMVHRLIMEMMLGRPLTAHEEVHHLNGVRWDNRPENLELWSHSQPSGQRIEDKVLWAKQILALYCPEALIPQSPRSES